MWNFYASRGRNAIGESPTFSLGDFTRDEPGGERVSGIILKKKAEAFAELDDEAGAELVREIDFDEGRCCRSGGRMDSGRGLDIPARMYGQRRMDRGGILGRLRLLHTHSLQKKSPAPISWSRAYTWQRPTLTGPIVPIPSALRRFTSGFGKGPGGSTALWSPECNPVQTHV